MEPNNSIYQAEPVSGSPEETEMEEVTQVYSVQPWLTSMTRHHSLGLLLPREAISDFAGFQSDALDNHLRCISADTIQRPQGHKTPRDEEDEAAFARTWSSKRMRLSIPERSDSGTSSYTTCPDCPPDTGSAVVVPVPELRHSTELCDPEPAMAAVVEKACRPPEEWGRVADKAEQKRVPADPERLKHRARRRKQAGSPQDVDWTNLPNVALLKIYRSLGHADRLSTSAVCSQWRRGFFNPSLWRRAILRPTSRGFLFARLLGRHVRRLKLNCESVWSPAVFRSMMEALKEASLAELEFV